MEPELRGKDFRIGDVLHDAWAFDPKQWRGNQMGVAEDFGPAVTRLLERDSDLAAVRTLVPELQRRFAPRFGSDQGEISGTRKK
jgi:hypothetical protein